MLLTRYYLISLCAVVLVYVGCARQYEVVTHSAESETHKHIHSQTLTFGADHYHAMMMYDPDAGRLGIMFMDKNEYPVGLLRAKKAKAVLTGLNGKSREFYLKNPHRPLPDNHPRYLATGYRYLATDRIIAQFDWLKEISQFRLKVWIPLKDVIHIIEYEYPKVSD